jgi:hypothetical protein
MVKASLFVLVAFALFATWLSAAEKTLTVEGTLVSSACYLENSSHPTGNDMGEKKNCGSDCLKRGDPAGLVTKDNHFYVLVAPSVALAPYVGGQVRATGSDHNGVIAVEKVEAAKDGKWEEVDLKSKK